MSLALPKFSAFSRTTTEAAPPAPRSVWKQRIAALVELVVWTGVALSLATHRLSDPAFTTSGDGGPVLNLLGRPGAMLSDILLLALGASREMVSRVMKDLEERGIIETQEDGSLKIQNRKS